MVVTRSQNNGAAVPQSEGKSGDTTLSKGERKTLTVVFISLVIDLLSFTVILPLLPSLLDYYGSKEDSLYEGLKQSVSSFRELVGAPDTPRWNSVLFGGLIGSLFSLLQFIASPVIGAASDVYGRKPLLILTMSGVAVSYGIWAVSQNFGLFVLARVVGGIFKGNISLSTAVVTDALPQHKRGKGMAVIGIAFSVGFVFGPLIGAVFSRWARAQQGEFYVFPALFALALAVIDVIYVAVVFKETLPEHRRANSISSGWQNTSYLINPVSLFRFSSVANLNKKDISSVQKIGLVYFLYLFFYSGLEFTLTFLTHNRLDYDSMQQGKMFFFIGSLMAIVQGGYVRRVPPGKEAKLAGIGILLLIPSFILMAFAHSALILYLGLTLFSFASATVVPSLTTMVSAFGGNDQKGTVMGIFRALGALARALGPMFASTVYWSFGSHICYIIGGVMLIVPYLILKAKPSGKSQ
ncbi:major facilitator superfamily domain-containing protein 10-like [Mya arenaria]|uniref:major facilitator superfamily domain-containing protein 10-like n=1 Tax=Mya arenaria TaxID=6604 RepID=UPI0022E18E90|nr:major facilitator superfamily domain-containing protein 10-like [Mya arenaria]